MRDFRIWPVVGLVYGTVLGLAAAFGGLVAFLSVLVFGVVGFLAGRVVEGELDLGELFGTRKTRRRSS